MAEASGRPEIVVEIAGTGAPVLSASARELDVQIPWELAATGTADLVLKQSDGPFESIIPIDLRTAEPQFEFVETQPRQSLVIKAAHQDFHGLVTAEDPARAGEVLHVYMTGLATSAHPPTGAPALQTVLAVAPICWLSSAIDPARFVVVNFAGLAPGMVGIDQVDMTLPSGFSSFASTLSCVSQAGPFPYLIGDWGSLWIKGN